MVDWTMVALAPFYAVAVTVTAISCGYVLLYFIDVARKQLEK